MHCFSKRSVQSVREELGITSATFGKQFLLSYYITKKHEYQQMIKNLGRQNTIPALKISMNKPEVTFESLLKEQQFCSGMCRSAFVVSQEVTSLNHKKEISIRIMIGWSTLGRNF